MKQPDGFIQGAEDHVCLLKKSLYGLKQSPRQWYFKFDQFMERIGYMRSNFDSCVYHKGAGAKSQVYLLLYVDDMLPANKNKMKLDKLKEELKSEFEMKDMDRASKILGIDLRRDRNAKKLFITQET